MQDKIKLINPEKWYRPQEIAENKFIVSMGKDIRSHYRFILRCIKSGKLEANNYARGKTDMKFFRVRGSEIIKYIRENE